MINFTDKILDNVHGFIDITNVEKQIIELQIFKRLQHIKQLSLVNWIFPGAEHTRYIHSLGVMHIADQMALHLGYDAEHRQLVRLAGLLHDLGHYPLSHEGEYAYMDTVEDSSNIIEYNNEKVKEKIDNINIKPKLQRMVNPKDYHHERITVSVISNDDEIKKIVEDNFKESELVNIKNICDIITGNVTNKKLSGLVQLVHSELDADRIDYLMRDATFSGTCYGNFELGLFLRNLKKIKYKEYDIVGLSKKGISLADQFLINRFYSYNQVVFNKHVAILGKMVSLLIKEFRQSSKLIDKSKLNKHIKEHCKTDEYKKFNDIKFWTELHNQNKFADEILNKLSESLIKNTEIGKVVNELRIIECNGEEMKKMLTSNSMYNDLSTSKNLFLLHDKMFTNQIPIKKYIELADSEKYVVDDREIRLYQESIVILEEDEQEPILLVDCRESLMSQLYNTKLAILREYKID